MLSLNPQTRRVISRIIEALGPAAEGSFVVGGLVRDALLSRDPRDIDLIVPGDVGDLSDQVASALGGVAVPFAGEWGVKRTVFRDGDDTWTVDIGAMRGDILADLGQRDFTVNAIAARLDSVLTEPHFVDPFGGRDDLDRRLIRAVSPANLDADPLRMLRAVRFSAQLGFDIDPETEAEIRARSHRADAPAPERKRDELLKLFDTARAGTALAQLDGLGLLTVLLPELAAAKGCTQPREHYWEVFDHLIETVRVLDAMFDEDVRPGPRLAEAQRIFREEISPLFGWQAHFRAEFADGASRLAYLKLTALLHDVSKPETRSVEENGRIHFYGHSEAGARRSDEILRRFRCSGRAIRYVALLIDEHLRPTQLSRPGQPPTKKALYRFRRDLGDAALDVLVLSLADHAAARGPTISWEAWRDHIRYALYVLSQIWSKGTVVRPVRLVTGDDLIETFHLQPGKLIGRLLASIEEAQASGEVTNREESLALARKLLAGEMSS
jgi:poly(A) polymerase